MAVIQTPFSSDQRSEYISVLRSQKPIKVVAKDLGSLGLSDDPDNIIIIVSLNVDIKISEILPKMERSLPLKGLNKKKSNEGYFLIFIVIVLLIIGLIIGYVYYKKPINIAEG